jgi:phosphate/sulfate permease
MGLLLLVLIGFLPFHYALNPKEDLAVKVHETAKAIQKRLPDDEKHAKTLADVKHIVSALDGKTHFADVPEDQRWALRTHLYKLAKDKTLSKDEQSIITSSVEYVPLWVVIGTAFALGIGTTVGYKRIVITVAEKIGKQHLTYAQGAAAETIAAITVLCATIFKLPVSTTHVLSSGVAGTMVANKSGVQSVTIKKIALAWLLTLPITMVLGGLIYAFGKLFV